LEVLLPGGKARAVARKDAAAVPGDGIALVAQAPRRADEELPRHAQPGLRERAPQQVRGDDGSLRQLRARAIVSEIEFAQRDEQDPGAESQPTPKREVRLGQLEFDLLSAVLDL